VGHRKKSNTISPIEHRIRLAAEEKDALPDLPTLKNFIKYEMAELGYTAVVVKTSCDDMLGERLVILRKDRVLFDLRTCNEDLSRAARWIVRTIDTYREARLYFDY